MIWFPAKNPAKKSLAGFLFLYKYTVQNCYSSTFVFVKIYFYVSENISISVLAFLFSGGKSCKRMNSHHDKL
ncbi:hypothetical protein DXA16_00475 [Streptococcus anginosus]|nr:hypothetical protein DXA16_00475 [Streptococcus anginosus]